MSCIIHFIGDNANVDELQRLCPIAPCNVFVKGEPRTTRPNARLARTSGISVVASDAEFEAFEQQQAEAIKFLRRYHTELKAMRMVVGVEMASIDFGIYMRNVIVQNDSFGPDLLAEIASLQLRLVLSQYPPQGRAKRVKQYRRALRGTSF
ncbi:hypothetical protein [Parvibium lacunae]|uniref:Uncharacterized protein n=1 Tax=Parvibium lacunae TaxID=1888893 RepID=A0A368L6U6_9BURK|nr:hypothetical protein [Parvibium lacunae]RCS59390.1 hypothetical protein DU000_01250 [Parvibium lacunae]